MVGGNLYKGNMEAVSELWKEKEWNSLVKFIGILPLYRKQYVGTGWVQVLTWN